MPLVTFARPLALLFLPCVVLALRLGRRRPGRRWRLASALRAAMLTCLILAAAGPAVRVPATGASVVFAVDRSLSVTASGARDAEAAFVRGALARMRSQDSAGIVTFGGRPALRAPCRLHQFDTRTFDLERELLDVGARRPLGLYSAERSIIDAVRLRHREGSDLAWQALRRWLDQPGASPARLVELAQRFPHAESALRQALAVLL